MGETTRLLAGTQDVIMNTMKCIERAKGTIIIITPTAIPEIIEQVAVIAYRKRDTKFFLTTKWDTTRYGDIIRKMSVLGNVMFRTLRQPSEYFAISRDAEEIILGPAEADPAKVEAIISTNPGMAKLFSQFIGPMFQATSQPLKL